MRKFSSDQRDRIQDRIAAGQAGEDLKGDRWGVQLERWCVGRQVAGSESASRWAVRAMRHFAADGPAR